MKLVSQPKFGHVGYRKMERIVIDEETEQQYSLTFRYDEGGMNWATSKPKPRGYYLTVMPTSVGITDGFRHQMTRGFSGGYRVVEEATRFSQKKLTALIEQWLNLDNPETLRLLEYVQVEETEKQNV